MIDWQIVLRVRAKTEKDFAKLVGKYKEAESVKGKLEREHQNKKPKPKQFNVTLILFREKVVDHEQKSDNTTVNVDLPTGTSVSSALAQQKELRQAGKKVRRLNNLEQFYIGDFVVTLNGLNGNNDEGYLRSHLHQMLIKKDPSTSSKFHHVCHCSKTETNSLRR